MQTQLSWVALDLAATAAECHHIGDVRDQLLPSLAQEIGAEIAIYHQLAFGADIQEYGVIWPDDDNIATALVSYPDVVQHSPLLRYFSATARPGVASIRQLLTAGEWHENPLYRESHRLLGIEDHLALVVHLRDGQGHAVTLAKDHGVFEQPARDLLALVAPHIRAAIRRSLAAASPYRVVRTFPTPTWTWRSGPAMTGPPTTPALTPREQEVLALATGGCTSQQVARRLDLAPRTVEKHLEHAFRKLGANCRSEAAARLQELGGGVDPGSSPRTIDPYL